MNHDDDLDREMNVSPERTETPEPFTPVGENQLKEDNGDTPETTTYLSYPLYTKV